MHEEKSIRLTLEEPFEKIVNSTLRDLYEDVKHLAPPNIEEHTVSEFIPTQSEDLAMYGIQLMNRKQLLIEMNEINVEMTVKHIKRDEILRKCFQKWRGKTREKKKPIENFDEKLDKFIENLKCKEEKVKKVNVENVKAPQILKNRYVAQKYMIMEQKAKLLEQEKVIEELKYGKMCESLQKSIKESKDELQEFYTNMKKTTKTKLGTICKTVEEVIEIQADLAPKLVREMERRAQERALKRKLILEKKRIMDEEKKRIAQEAVERKRVQDEEEKKAALEAIKLKRLKEIEANKLRALNKQRYLEGCSKANKYYRKKLLKRGLKAFKIIIILRDTAESMAEEYYSNKLTKNALICWHRNVEIEKNEKICKADNFYKTLLLKKGFSMLSANCHLSKLNLQVAEDYYSYNLMLRVFKLLKIATMNESYYQYRQSLRAMNHYENRILVQYFYQWKTLKAVLQLERAKEEKKKKWRQKVLEILPDYRPQINDF
ncbi:PREDICTED: coiled-coil domain-containing protein 191 isoform X2 [Nicrophorus vespilloides]|uniref:Coiled-coil domain-containing protein 191 isoform X2 n=1 Tax=Nicrophorus vespilloides TaxID=110193 RepID=A0ABM1NCN6_NICVS|nr:PREDICTED: coiled-coil domain-containing protein 191 isoform X2 [Nicrophorus vespilloides]